MTRLARRDFMRFTGTLAVTAAAGGIAAACGGGGSKGGSPSLSTGRYARLDPRKPENFTAGLHVPSTAGGLFGILDVSREVVELTARPQPVAILPGTRTELLAYEVQGTDRSYLNPVLRVQRGAAMAARLVNGLSDPTIIHWHGLHVDWRNDGHPSYAIAGGAAYDYQFTVLNRSGTYWYHPHPHGLSARQVYGGLAGLLIVEDEEEQHLRQRLDLTLGVTDIPLVLQDRRFSDRGGLVYPSQPADQFTGVVGDVVLVNGSPTPMLAVDSRVYRFRVLNGSNARVYRLALTKGSERLPFHLIGTDGGLLARPERVTDVFLGPAERADILVDLGAMNAGDSAFLISHAFDPMHNEMGGMGGGSGMQGGGHGGMAGMTAGMMAGSRLADGDEFHLLKLSVQRRTAYDLPLPRTLAQVAPLDTTGAARRPVNLAPSGMSWLINGTQFDMARELFRTHTNAVEVWEISNAAASMPHPMHLHGFQFQVLERRTSPAQLRGLALDPHGRTAPDLGWKDTVLVWPGETVVIAVSFAHSFTGEQLYLFHCHNLEHEDGGMMVNYRVV